jgi:hypothetical protein
LVFQLVKAAEIQQAENQSIIDKNGETDNQTNGKIEQTGTQEDDVKPGTSGIKSGKGSNRGKGKRSSEEVPMETE